MSPTLRVGTRGSALALAQTGTVASALAAKTGVTPEIITISTEGDRSTESLASLGGTGVFASALRDALLAGEVDVVVHSLKDLPTAPHPGL
ncbi:MAG: hydroxymethylbilane synthase, partial [Rhodoglobus sp.]